MLLRQHLLTPLLIIVVLPSLASAQILITEVMYNPEGDDRDREWFEAINLGKELDVQTGRNGWRIYDGNNRLIKGENFIWQRQEVIIFVQDKNKFLSEYPQANLCRILESSFTLKNKGSEIKILDKNKNVLAEFRYNNSFGGNGNGYSLIFENGVLREGNFKRGTPCNYPEPFEEKNKEEKKYEEPKVENISKIENIQVPSSSEVLSLNKETSRAENLKEENKVIKNEIAKDSEIIYANLLISEFFPNQKGKDENEFIEIYNGSDNEIDLSKFDLKIGGKSYKLWGTILPQSFRVFYKKDLNFNIRNNGEDISLLLDGKKEVFYIKYVGKAPEGKSFARDKDGNWKWTTPTPGQENIFVSPKETKLSSYEKEERYSQRNGIENFSNLVEDLNNKNSYSPYPTANTLKFLDFKILLIGSLLALILSGLIVYFLK